MYRLNPSTTYINVEILYSAIKEGNFGKSHLSPANWAFCGRVRPSPILRRCFRWSISGFLFFRHVFFLFVYLQKQVYQSI